MREKLPRYRARIGRDPAAASLWRHASVLPVAGPGPPGLRLPPRPEVLRAVATAADRLDALIEGTVEDAERMLRSMPGIGVWSAAEVRRLALGDADAVSYGDYHLPNLVSLLAPRSAPGHRRAAGRAGRTVRPATGSGRPAARAHRPHARAPGTAADPQRHAVTLSASVLGRHRVGGDVHLRLVGVGHHVVAGLAGEPGPQVARGTGRTARTGRSRWRTRSGGNRRSRPRWCHRGVLRPGVVGLAAAVRCTASTRTNALGSL